MHGIPRFLAGVLVLLAAATTAAEREVGAVYKNDQPQIDGVADPLWDDIPALEVLDPVAGVPLRLKAMYNGSRIFWLVTYPDQNESRLHKAYHWNADQGRYTLGPEREDTFVFKWAMQPDTLDLTLKAEHPYEADVWYWKADRTDPVGYADDKYQRYTRQPLDRSGELLSASGRRFYLLRRGDTGRSSYEPRLPLDYEGDELARYEHRVPRGSRADIIARGRWGDGRWVIEFSRRLVTGHDDDVQFDVSRRYRFGVSRFEIAGRAENPAIDEPRFGSGEIGEHLILVFR